jgi:ABC-2 type transport system permease protein
MSELQAISGGQFRGFRAIYQKELAYWFRSYRWIVQLILWISLTTVPAIWMTPDVGDDRGVSYLTIFTWLSSTLLALGTIFLAQSSIIEEKLTQSLILIWSKPLSASGFILAKFSAFAVLIGIIALGIPAILTLVAAMIVGLSVPILNYIFAIATVYLLALFILALTLMLGTLFERVSNVSASAIFALFVGSALSVNRNTRQIEPYTFWALARYAATTIVGKIPSEMGIAIVGTMILTIAVLAIAIWRMKQYEF